MHVAKNPPRGVMIEYYLAQEPAGDVMLTITDEGGEIIQQFSSRSEEGSSPPSTKAGMNRFVWDMRYPGIQLPPSAGALSDFESVDHSPPAPPVAPPGRYIVRLTVDGQAHEQPFEIRKDPRVKAGAPDLRAQFELMVDIQDRVSEVADTAGICVGIFGAYGPAQRLYVKRGYIPDGRGVCKGHVPIRRGETHVVDHDLIIWLTKSLRATDA